MNKIVILTAALSCALASAAHADDYSVVGAGCKIDPNSAPYMLSLNGSISFASGSTGQITLWCPITHPIDAPSWIELLATDTAAGSYGYVQALHYSVNANGAMTLHGGVLSGTNADGAAHWYQSSLAYSHNPNNYYLVRVNLYRSSSSQTVSFYGLSVY